MLGGRLMGGGAEGAHGGGAEGAQIRGGAREELLRRLVTHASVRSIARELGKAESPVRRAFQRLVAAGLLQEERGLPAEGVGFLGGAHGGGAPSSWGGHEGAQSLGIIVPSGGARGAAPSVRRKIG